MNPFAHVKQWQDFITQRKDEMQFAVSIRCVQSHTTSYTGP
jgi:hypothetical protein